MIAGGDAPWEYIELILCRDVYHCTPNKLDDIPLDKILAHLTCISVEAQVRKQKEAEISYGE